MPSLVECIPNVSEGRRTAVIDGLGAPLDARPDCALLHVHPDVDHNRTVYTAVGEPEALLAALEEFYARAVKLIDLRTHRGAHPRLGAVDVCPFVPLPEHGSTMADCIALSHRLGERLAERFELPVYLYADAAVHDQRRDLTNIRHGQFEGLDEKLTHADWKPDYGPDHAHVSAGATVVGARGPLVAYNVVLDTDELEVARAVAAEVRTSSGGLPAVRAMGVSLSSRKLVQVSMNLVDPSTTPLHVAVDEVRRRAAARGVDVLETELVGLAPLDVVVAAASTYLQLAEFDAHRVLEEAISRALWIGAGGEGSER